MKQHLVIIDYYKTILDKKNDTKPSYNTVKLLTSHLTEYILQNPNAMADFIHEVSPSRTRIRGFGSPWKWYQTYSSDIDILSYILSHYYENEYRVIPSFHNKNPSTSPTPPFAEGKVSNAFIYVSSVDELLQIRTFAKDILGWLKDQSLNPDKHIGLISSLVYMCSLLGSPKLAAELLYYGFRSFTLKSDENVMDAVRKYNIHATTQSVFCLTAWWSLMVGRNSNNVMPMLSSSDNLPSCPIFSTMFNITNVKSYQKFYEQLAVLDGQKLMELDNEKAVVQAFIQYSSHMEKDRDFTVVFFNGLMTNTPHMARVINEVSRKLSCDTSLLDGIPSSMMKGLSRIDTYISQNYRRLTDETMYKYDGARVSNIIKLLTGKAGMSS